MTFSRAMACAGDQSRETSGFCKKSQGESGWYPRHDEDASPNALAVNPGKPESTINLEK
jgi:hypothetical protein